MGISPTFAPVDHAPVIIIGAAQAGLATAYHLARLGIPCTLVDAHGRVGDAWRTRWDSLALFSPARYSSLPNWPYPGNPMRLPSKDEVADYHEGFARHHQFDIRLGHKVEAVAQDGAGFALTIKDCREKTVTTWVAKAVVVATGPFATPYVPTLDGAPAPGIHQVHVANYRRPGDLPDGPALVVGTGASGSQIAAELSQSRKVYLSGPETPHMPRKFLGLDFYWWLYTTGFANIRRDSWLGRRFLSTNTMGDALIGKSLAEIAAECHLERRSNLTGFQDGLPVFADGASAADIRTLIWATGYRNDYSWIRLPVLDGNGHPMQTRGVAHNVQGLYFVGLKFLYRTDSGNLGGMSRDAKYIARHIARNAK